MAETRSILQELLVLMTEKIVVHENLIVEFYNERWDASVYNTNTVIFGHVNELIWLIIDTCETLGLETREYQGLYGHLWNYSLNYGWDFQQGRYIHSLP